MDIVKKAYECINSFKQSDALRSAYVRKASAKLFRELDDKSTANVFMLCEKMLDEQKWPMWMIAYDWAFRLRKQYDENTFAVFDKWLNTYIKDWGDCDDFCTHALGHLIGIDNSLFEKVKLWTQSDNFAVRRAAAVCLIYPIRYNMYDHINPFEISDILMQDEHYLVQKGYGWMLKILSEKEPQKVVDYLLKNKNVMPRTAFRYALEKLNKDTKGMLMS